MNKFNAKIVSHFLCYELYHLNKANMQLNDFESMQMHVLFFHIFDVQM